MDKTESCAHKMAILCAQRLGATTFTLEQLEYGAFRKGGYALASMRDGNGAAVGWARMAARQAFAALPSLREAVRHA